MDTLRIGVAAATAADKVAGSPELDLREVLNIGKKAKEAVAKGGLVRNLKNAAARTLQSQQQSQPAASHPQPQIIPSYPPQPQYVPPPSYSNSQLVPPPTSDPNRLRPDSGFPAAVGVKPDASSYPAGDQASKENLRAGNYLVATWDAKTDGHAYDGVICQIGAYLPHGADFIRETLEDGFTPAEMAENPDKYVNIINGRAGMYVKAKTGSLMQITTTKIAMQELLAFLEKGKNSTRPAYDGVLLLSHIRESIPVLLRAVKKHDLEQRFRGVVAGMGDISAYLADHHKDKFQADNRAAGPQVDLGLFNVFTKVNGYKPNKYATCEQRATHSYEILRELLGEKPTYSNFFSRYIHPMDSRAITEMAKFRGLRERLELFRPLQLHLAKELQGDAEDLLVLDGVYAPQRNKVLDVQFVILLSKQDDNFGLKLGSVVLALVLFVPLSAKFCLWRWACGGNSQIGVNPTKFQTKVATLYILKSISDNSPDPLVLNSGVAGRQG